MKGYEESLKMADEAMKKLIEDLGVSNDSKSQIRYRWVSLVGFIESRFIYDHPHYEED